MEHGQRRASRTRVWVCECVRVSEWVSVSVCACTFVCLFVVVTCLMYTLYLVCDVVNELANFYVLFCYSQLFGRRRCQTRMFKVMTEISKRGLWFWRDRKSEKKCSDVIACHDLMNPCDYYSIALFFLLKFSQPLSVYFVHCVFVFCVPLFFLAGGRSIELQACQDDVSRHWKISFCGSSCLKMNGTAKRFLVWQNGC